MPSIGSPIHQGDLPTQRAARSDKTSSSADLSGTAAGDRLWSRGQRLQTAPWQPSEPLAFEQSFETAPSTGKDLQLVALWCIADIQYDLLHGDLCRGRRSVCYRARHLFKTGSPNAASASSRVDVTRSNASPRVVDEKNWTSGSAAHSGAMPAWPWKLRWQRTGHCESWS